MPINKVLIVSLKAGAGHFKAAKAIEMALIKQFPKIEERNIDLLDYSNILTNTFYQKTYLDLVNNIPELYAWLYKHISNDTTEYRLLLDRINAQKLKKFVINFKPDLIICTHFIPANLLTYYREKHLINCKIMVTLTDFETHPLWVDQNVDYYTVATEEMKNSLIKAGINRSTITVTGIPIEDKFSQKYNLQAIRNKLNLTDKFTISLFSGGFGVGPIEEIYKKFLLIFKDFQIIIIAGNNKELFKKLYKIKKTTKNKTLVFGFIDNIEEISAISDIIISKPGGLTVSENLALNIPLLIFNPIPGQEEANADYLLKHKAALRANSVDELIGQIIKIREEPKILVELKKNIVKIAKPHAAIKIVNLIKTM